MLSAVERGNPRLGLARPQALATTTGDDRAAPIRTPMPRHPSGTVRSSARTGTAPSPSRRSCSVCSDRMSVWQPMT
ncbi:hypothetical protein PUR34_15020 [Streptomyces sp. JV185]|uniref:hypothetical protein n=1 Tax=Streptomyces sp. JV185 TaxID=858638 RepID=UPI002E7928DC|nr:hypothetical protein [Streptomyces sp. JV185]MEE1769422.1 hypothetical protein [Streptomyces sp. JV185]